MSRARLFRRPAVVLCDFDGTITTEDVIVAIWRRFAPPGWERAVEEMLARRKPLREGVAEIFAQIPSARVPEIVRYARETVRFRPGFEELLGFCQGQGLEFVVASGGVDFFVEPLLEPFSKMIQRTCTIPSDLSEETIRLLLPFACDRCGMCKARLMEEYAPKFRILIGDSVTDLHGAEEADLVFARDRLKKMLEEGGLPYEPWDTFYDVADTLSAHYLGSPARSGSRRP